MDTRTLRFFASTCFALAAMAALSWSAVHEYTSTTPLAVPDAGCPAVVTSVIAVADSLLVAEVRVGVWAEHTYRGDLELRLVAPDGTAVVLMADAGGAADNVNALFTDSAPGWPDATNHAAPPPHYVDHRWRPAEPLAALRGAASAGDWTLEACDDAGGDTGTVQQWSLFFLTDVVLLDPPSQAGTACPGDAVPYELGVLNGTATAQAFALSYTGNAWVADGPVSTGTLDPLASEDVVVAHTVPVTALPLEPDTVTVTATGTVSDSATATTRVALVAGWGDLAPLPPAARPTRDHSLVYAGGKLYKIGGYDGATQPYLDIYDVATDTWSTGADMPGARYWMDCVAIAGKIYCAGGYLSSGQTTLYVYDIASDSWATGAVMSAYRYSYAGVALGGKYYVIGGYGAGYTATTWVYDPATNTWDESGPSLSAGRRFHSAGVIGGRVYVAGGYDGSYLSGVEMLDPAAIPPAWVPVASMPTSWLRAADAVLDDRYLVLAGGEDNSTAAASDLVWLYDAVTDSWSRLPALQHSLYGAEADGDGATFWIASGRAYEGGAYSYAPYTTRPYACAERTDLVVTKDDGVATVVPGAPLTYTITVTNLGPNPARSASVRDQFPAAVEGVTWTCVATGAGTCTGSGTGSILDSVNLGVGESATYTATGTVAATATGIVSNTAAADLGSVWDLAPADNRATDVDLVVGPTDLAVGATVDPPVVTWGDAVTYTITVGNAGPFPAPGCAVTDVFPAALESVSWTCAGAGGGTCAAGGSGGIADSADLPVGASVTYAVTGTVASGAPAGPLDNTATVAPTGDVTDLDPSNNSATATTEVVLADLVVTKGDAVLYVLPGASATYVITVVNDGPNDALGALVQDLFPAVLTGVTWTCAGSGGATCAPAGSGDIDQIVDLPAGGEVVFQATGAVPVGSTGWLVNTAVVAAPAATADPDPGDNQATDVDALELPVFCDDFEDGTTDAWSTVMP